MASALVMMQMQGLGKSHHDGGEEGDGQRQHAVHIVLAGLGQMWRQVIAQFVQSISDLFLKPSSRDKEPQHKSWISLTLKVKWTLKLAQKVLWKCDIRYEKEKCWVSRTEQEINSVMCNQADCYFFF